MINTQTQIDSLIDLAVIQRKELKQLVESLPQLRDHLSSEIERNLEEIEPSIRSELEQFVAARALDAQAKTSAELGAKIEAMARNLESTTAARYSVIMAERAENANLLAKAEARIAEAASALPAAVKTVVADELSRFPRAGEIDQLRKEFAEPRGLNPRGRWEAGVTYYKLDLVAYNGDSYVANEETKDRPSRASTKWTLNAARGNAGGGSFVNPTAGDYTAAMITNVPSGTISATNVQDAIDELASEVVVSQNTLDATVTNAESVAITKGQVVYAFSATGNRMSVKLALNTADATSAKTIGVVADTSIAAGGVGTIRCVGVLDGLTLGSYSDGDTLYLGATAGSVTATKPYAPNHLVYVGIVERANNGNGELYVRIQNGYELDEIHDVQITSAPLAGALLMRDATNSLWKANRLTGTAGQVTVTNADTSVTLSLPTALTSINSVTAAAATDLTLAGGTAGSSAVKVTNTTAATSTTTGSLQTAGGLGVVGAGYFGGLITGPSLNLTGTATGLTNKALNIASTVSGPTPSAVYLSSAITASSGTGDFGAFTINPTLTNTSGGTYSNAVGLDILIGSVTATNPITNAIGLRIANIPAGATNRYAIRTGTGVVTLGDTTAATNTTSGALQVAGGVGVQGSIWAGGAGVFGTANTAGSGVGSYGATPSSGVFGFTSGSMTGTNMYGFTDQTATYTLNGAATEVIDHRAYATLALGTNALTNWYGFQSTLNSKTGAGVLTNAYAFYASSPTAATNNYAFFSAGTAPSVLGGALTVSGLVSTPAATTTTAGLRVPHGAAPTSPVNGDIWTTTAGLFVRINGVTVGPLT